MAGAGVFGADILLPSLEPLGSWAPVPQSWVPDARATHLAGVRPYKCSLCDKAFTQRCSLSPTSKKITVCSRSTHTGAAGQAVRVRGSAAARPRKPGDPVLPPRKHHPRQPLLRRPQEVAVALQGHRHLPAAGHPHVWRGAQEVGKPPRCPPARPLRLPAGAPRTGLELATRARSGWHY